jgi:hypothetical protein
MKNDPTTTLLNFVLAVLVIVGVVCAYFSIRWTNDQRNLTPVVMQVNAKVNQIQSLINDVNNYNQQAKSPEITHMVQGLMPKTAAAK